MSKLLVVNDCHPEVILNAARRFLGGIPLAICTTALLLYAMQQLVHMDSPPTVDTATPKIPPINMDIPTKITVRQEEPPERPTVVELPPEVNIITPVEVNIEHGVSGMARVIADKPTITGVAGTGQMIPFIKVPPQYPQAALSKGVEGYVDVMFDVTELGTTDNIRIIAYEPSSVFNRSVIKAIKNWKFKPNVADGVPVRTPDVRDRVRFNLEE